LNGEKKRYKDRRKRKQSSRKGREITKEEAMTPGKGANAKKEANPQGNN
jgi:hypothetical protein